MKLYHATTKQNAKQIDLDGELKPNEGMENKLDALGVYGFDNIEDARDFAIYCKNLEDQYVVYEFEADDAETDPEYDGNAFVVHHAVDAIKIEIGDEVEA